MIGTMNLAVAVHAIFTQHILVRTPAGQAFAAIGYAGMKGSCMALLAKGWAPGIQQWLIDRAMGSMTQSAILRCWRVLPQDGPALVLVAAETVIV